MCEHEPQYVSKENKHILKWEIYRKAELNQQFKGSTLLLGEKKTILVWGEKQVTRDKGSH